MSSTEAKPSWIDRLQKDAQPTELDPSNTNPVFFYVLSLIQWPVCYAIAVWLDFPPLMALLPLASHTVMFVVSHYFLRHDNYFDITGETTLFPLICYSYYAIEGEPTPRQTLCTVLALIWTTRLGLFLGWRILERGFDWRFNKLMDEPCYNLFGWTSQGTWIFLQLFHLFHLHHYPQDGGDATIGAVEVVGVLIFLAGIMCEHTADMQKTRWNAKTKSGQQKTWIAEGLWKYSRHPNYFGENLLHFGIAVASLDFARFNTTRFLVAMVAPAWSCFFLVFTSLMLLEKRLDAKFGGNPSYELYKQRTSILIPWPLRDVTGLKSD